MVKPGGRSKVGKGGKGKGSGAGGSGGPGSAPSSPTRRLKKGGKRGRRLCHMDGCTLCPSFGFEGDVAVSCSHHKEPGMRNLTARRCQHEGCFTVANFGMPGDKPGFCAAHSTKGMVNRNKPRGAEGVLAGVPIARSSRRAAKANTAIHSSSETARARAVNEVAPKSSFPSTFSVGSSGTESSSGQTSLADGDEGDEDVARRFLTSRSGSSEHMSSLKGDSDDEPGGMDGDAGMGNGRGSDGIGVVESDANDGALAGTPSGTPSPSPGLTTAFSARTAGTEPPDGLADLTQYGGHKRPDVAAKPTSVTSRVRARGSTAAAVTAGMQLFQRPVAAAQEAFLAARGGMNAAQRGHADGLLLGGGVHRVTTPGIDSGFPGDPRAGSLGDAHKEIMGGFLIDGAALDAGLDCTLNMDLSTGLDDLLSSDDSLETEGKGDESSMAMAMTMNQASRPRGMASSVVRGTAGSRVVSNGSGLVVPSGVAGSAANGGAPGAMECEGEVFVGDGGEDFSLESLPVLNGMDLSGLNQVGDGCMGTVGETRRQAVPPHPPPGAAPPHAIPAPVNLHLGISPANGCGPPPSSPRVTPNENVCAGIPNSASEASGPVSSVVPAQVTTVLHSEDAWWDVLEGEEYVAMPEPIWGANLDGQGLDDESRIHEEARTARNGGSLPRGSSSVTAPSVPLEGSGDPSVGVGRGIGAGSGTATATGSGPGSGSGSGSGREGPQSMGLDVKNASTLLSATFGLGGAGTMAFSDDPFIEDKARADRGGTSPVFPFLSCRPPGDRDELDAGANRVSPKKRPRLPSTDAESLHHFNPGAALRPTKRDPGANGIFMASASNGGFHAATPMAPILQSQLNAPLINEGLRAGTLPLGGNQSKSWANGTNGDPISPSKFMATSPSKCLSASPSKSVLSSLTPQSASPWTAGGLCPPPQQTQAAGRA